MRLFTGKEGRQGHLPSLLLHTSLFVSNPVFDVGSGLRYQQWIIHFSQSVSGCFTMLLLADSLSPFLDCNSMILLPLASAYLIPLWGGSKSKLKLHKANSARKITDLMAHPWDGVHSRSCTCWCVATGGFIAPTWQT